MIEWNDDFYSVGITYIDEQHKTLVNLINAIELNQNNPDREFIEKIINTLVEYTKNHFRDEEKFLKNIRYNQFDSHKEQHLRFEKTVKAFVQQYHESENSTEVLGKILKFLSDWLTSHILIEDIAYRNYMLEGVGGS